MPFNGSGVFTRLHSWIQDRNNGIKIRADRHDEEDDNFAAGLSNCITKDGQTVISADIPFNGKRLTGLGDPQADTDALNVRTADGRYGASAVLNTIGCRLDVEGHPAAATVKLHRYNGKYLVINGAPREIPADGLILDYTDAPNGFGTPTYIYAYIDDSGDMALEASLTGHSTESGTGIEIKTGDSTRTLVGMVQSVDTFGFPTQFQFMVLSWYNRKPVNVQFYTGADFTTASRGMIEVGHEDFRCPFLTWGNESAECVVHWSCWTSTPDTWGLVAPAIDGDFYRWIDAWIMINPTGVGFGDPKYYTCTRRDICMEGSHYFHLFTRVGEGDYLNFSSRGLGISMLFNVQTMG